MHSWLIEFNAIELVEIYLFIFFSPLEFKVGSCTDVDCSIIFQILILKTMGFKDLQCMKMGLPTVGLVLVPILV